ncbi:MAG TPA: hypothetical protein VKA02_03980 [Candidatus Acidoferrum sp.]|nr:hypothetical protein [Candidatus Acidoferrum sp.]
MKLFRVFLTLSLAAPCLAPIPLLGQNTNAQAPSAQASSTSASTATPARQDDAAAGAAERKRRFDEDKAVLESAAAKPQSQTSPDANGPAPEPCKASEGDLLISPIFVNMFAGDTHSFSLFDFAGRKLTYLADWSIDDSYVADLTIEDSIPVLKGKHTGRVRLIARVDSHSGEANINVFTHEDLKSGIVTAEWLAPPVPCIKRVGTVQRVDSTPMPAPCSASEIELAIAPQFAGIFVGRTQPFRLFDAGGHDLASQADWSVDDSQVADLTIQDGIPVLTGKETGTVRVTARLDSRSREAIIEVVTLKDWNSGAAHFSTRPVPCSRSLGTFRPMPPEARRSRSPEAGKPTSPQQ